jgi:hypothetical protein
MDGYGERGNKLDRNRLDAEERERRGRAGKLKASQLVQTRSLIA